MRTIAQSLTELNQVKTDINNAIVSKGGTSSTSMSTFATSINNLPSGASLNVEYSMTAPTDTTKLWIKTDIIPSKVSLQKGFTGVYSGNVLEKPNGLFQSYTTDAQITYYNEQYYILNGIGGGTSYGNNLNTYNIVNGSGTTLKTQNSDFVGGNSSSQYGSPYIVIGGNNGSYSSRVLMANILSNTFSTTIPITTSAYSAYLIDGNYCYTISSGAFRKVNLNDGTYISLTAPTSTNYIRSCGLTINNNYIYYTQGTDTAANQPSTNSIFKFDTTTNSWQTIQTISDTNFYGEKTMVYFNNKLWVFKTDNKVFTYDLITNTLERKNDLSISGKKRIFVDYNDNTFKFAMVNGSNIKVYQINPQDPTVQANEITIDTDTQNNVFTIATSDKLDIKFPIKQVLQGDSSNIGQYKNTYIHDGTSWVEINGKV